MVRLLLIVSLFCACQKDEHPTPPTTPPSPQSPTVPVADEPVSVPAARAPAQTVDAQPKRQFPAQILKSDEDVDGDGEPDPVKLSCIKDTPLHQCSGFRLEVADQAVDIHDIYTFIEKERDIVEQIGFALLDMSPDVPGREIKLSFVSDSEIGTFEGDHVFVFGYKNAKLVEIWNTSLYMDIAWQDRGWEVRSGQCVKFAKVGTEGKNLGIAKVTTTRFAWDGRELTNDVLGTKKEPSDCGAFGRCPFVYAGHPERLLGEVLRNQVGMSSWQDDSIRVPRELVDDGSLKIRIAEEKPDEVSFVDAVWLDVGGKIFHPEACETDHCQRDGKLRELATDESFVLHFRNLPDAGPIRLWASGYYELRSPVPLSE